MKNRFIYTILAVTIFLLPALFCSPHLYGQKLNASVSKLRVAVGEPFQLTYTTNLDISVFNQPDLSEFDVYSGPSETKSQFDNGYQTITNYSFSYVLIAKKEGKLKLGPASVETNGKKVVSNVILLECNKNPASQPQAGTQQQSPAAGTSASGNLFARIHVSRNRVFVGEQISVTCKVYSRYQLQGFQNTKYPSYNGFWSQEMPSQNSIPVSNEIIDGMKYQVAELTKTFLFPQRSGTLEIGSMYLECVVLTKTNRPPRSLSEYFFGSGGYEESLMKISTPPVKIEVIPLPEQGKPGNFSGAVGNFSFKANVDKEKLKANEAVNLKISVSGSGNLKLIEPFAINFPEGIETYDPKVNENVSVSASGVSGSKTFEYLLIPRKPGNYKIDKVNFTYFSPEKKSYVVIPSTEFNLQVEKGDGSSEGENTPVLLTQQDVQLMGNDIRYIKSNPESLVKKEEFFFGSPGFIAGLTAPGLAFLIFLLVRKRRQELNSDIALVKSRKAARMAQKRFSVAGKFMKENKKEEFFAEVLRALQGYLGDKLQIPVSDLSKDTVLATLRSKQVQDETLNRLGKIMEECEFARYAPASVQTGLEIAYNEASSVLSAIETELK